MNDGLEATDTHVVVSTASERVHRSTSTTLLPENPIDQPLADMVYDMARATVPYGAALLIILASLLFVGLAVDLPDVFIFLVGAASAFLFGQAMNMGKR